MDKVDPVAAVVWPLRVVDQSNLDGIVRIADADNKIVLSIVSGGKPMADRTVNALNDLVLGL